MATLRDLKNRIRSVENTRKITRAMEMVAASKLRRFQTLMTGAQPYTEGLERLVKRLSHDYGQVDHPLFEKREEKNTALILLTSDTGLCGSFNHDLIAQAKSFISRQKNPVKVIAVGKSGATALKAQGMTCEKSITDLRASRVEGVLQEFKQMLESAFRAGEVDSVYVVYSHFSSLTQFMPVTEKILPMENTEETPANAGASSRKEYIYEPLPDAIFNRLIPIYFEAKTRLIFLESLVSEQLARMQSMHQATENASEMIDALVLARNKARQASITKEIIEVVSGSQAQKNK